mgnify:CR=1 FL=1
MEQNQKRGVKLISIFFYVLAGIFVILGIADLFLITINPLAILFSIILIALAVLLFFTAKDLRNGKNWARTSALIISGLGILWALSLLIQTRFILGVFYLIVSGLIEYYLLFKQK